MQIDAVLRPRDTTPWKDENPAFGVAFKLPGQNVGDAGYFQWAAQAVDYTHAEWKGYGRLQVFVCPTPAIAVMMTAAQVAEGNQWRRKFASDQAARKSARFWAQVAPADGVMSAEDRERDARKWWNEINNMSGDAEVQARSEGFGSAFERSQRQGIVTARSMMRLLGQLNVGELMPAEQHGWSLLRSGHVLWSQEQGVRNKWSLHPRLASR